jgi:hypothetical protein
MAETKAYIQELADKDGNKVYPVTKAEAVYMNDNATTLDKQIENMQQSFQDGVDTLVNKLKSLGVTPEENSPAGIAAAIEVLAQNKFNDGVASIKIPAIVSITTNGGAGQENYDITDGYYTEAIVDQSGAYNAGRLQGREDVKANPNGYGFYTEAQYTAFGESKFSAGIKAVQADPSAYNLTTHGSRTEYFQAAYDEGTITLRRTTGGIDDNMGSQYCGDGNGEVTGGYTYKW